MITSFVIGNFEYSIRYAGTPWAGSYVAEIRDVVPDWQDSRKRQESFGNGISAENRILEWMANPEKALDGQLSRNESVARGFIKIVPNHVPKSF